MKILALETSGLGGSVAIADGPQILHETSLSLGQRSARSLAPAIQDSLREVGWGPRDVEILAVTVGPGSFTGLRVGVVTAKALAYATGCRIVGVNTLQALAQPEVESGKNVLTILDAQRGEYFAASWTRNAAGEILPVQPTSLLSADELLRSLGADGVIMGPAVVKLAGSLPPGVRAKATHPQASAVAALALHLAHRGETTDPFALAPLYLRRTAAEEQWEKRKAKAE
jgi:tRNA threonylcarbamoyladenosine biosynthesis protein TsaB